MSLLSIASAASSFCNPSICIQAPGKTSETNLAGIGAYFVKESKDKREAGYCPRLVVAVHHDSTAYIAGLRPGDLVIEVISA